MHLEMRVAAKRGQRHEGAAVAKRQARFSPAIVTLLPRVLQNGSECVGCGPAS
jgi:hypothetical protein